ncbi:uncharacterized protein G2W53_014440 [Senna tora]|uniref:Uncharacterized protein n=1 Tax=Senna tora TaxID=362788 RepID=A0A834WTK3_9FABA|nr:uncharacterized protein G2W53_014440 [Senna tora]
MRIPVKLEISWAHRTITRTGTNCHENGGTLPPPPLNTS